jgi:hypothetical protein
VRQPAAGARARAQRDVLAFLDAQLSVAHAAEAEDAEAVGADPEAAVR